MDLGACVMGFLRGILAGVIIVAAALAAYWLLTDED